LGIENQALIFSTNNLPGFDLMALDLNGKLKLQKESKKANLNGNL